MSLKMYILIRDDLPEAQQAVQAGHALAQFGLEHPKKFKAWQEDSNVLVYLSVRNIHYWHTTLEDGGFKHSMFHEPDMWERWMAEMGMDTAIAVAPNWTCQYLLFKDLPLAFAPKPRESAPALTESCDKPLPTPKSCDKPLPTPKRRWWKR